MINLSEFSEEWPGERRLQALRRVAVKMQRHPQRYASIEGVRGLAEVITALSEHDADYINVRSRNLQRLL